MGKGWGLTCGHSISGTPAPTHPFPAQTLRGASAIAILENLPPRGLMPWAASWSPEGGQEPPAQTSTSEAPPPGPVTFPPASCPPAALGLCTPSSLHPRWACSHTGPEGHPTPPPDPSCSELCRGSGSLDPGRSLFQNVPAPLGSVSAQSRVKITNQHHQQAARTSQQEADK